MPSPKPTRAPSASDPRSQRPPPGPGVPDDEFEGMMESMKKTREKIQGGPQTTSLSDLRGDAVGLAKKRAKKKKKKAEKK